MGTGVETEPWGMVMRFLERLEAQMVALTSGSQGCPFLPAERFCKGTRTTPQPDQPHARGAKVRRSKWKNGPPFRRFFAVR